MRCQISKENFCSSLFSIPFLSMLAQFQERYPTASLLSELLTIYQGKFVVQVSVQIEGVTRATGMAAAETVELAEDQARLRAIALIATQGMTAFIPQRDIVPSIPELIKPSSATDSNHPRGTPKPADASTDNYPELTLGSRDYFSLKTTNSDSIDEDFGIEPITSPSSNPVSSFSNVTPFVPRTSTEDPQLLDPIGSESQLSVTEPIDLSDTLLAIETELRNLRWTAEQERKYLKRIYNKESRDLLGTQQLFEFLNYLQVFTQTSKELERLGWTNQQGKEYLVQTYNKQSRQYLSYQELKEFLQHLQANS